MKLCRLSIIHFFALTFLTIAFTSGCTKKNKTVVSDNLDTQLGKMPELSLFQAAIKKAGLQTFTQGGGPFTLFVPNNAAFNAMGIANEADLNTINPNTLVSILSYHIQPVQRSFVEIPAGPNAPMAAQSGATMYASKNTTTGIVYINGAAIITNNLKVSNGIIHIINKVLVPPAGNVLTMLKTNNNYKLFVQAITKAKLDSIYSLNPVTIFAPGNTAFSNAGYDSSAIANATGATLTTLTSILKYHLLKSRGFSNNLKDGPYVTILGASITISNNGTKIKGINNTNPIGFTVNDIITSNGVIHGIEDLLKP